MNVVFPPYPESIWCVVANVVRVRPYGPGGAERRQGTKHFAPGAKVYVFQRIAWSDAQRLRVLGRHRRSNRLIQLTIGVELLANWRARKVYHPVVIRRILADEHPSQSRVAELRAALASGNVDSATARVYHQIVDGVEERIAAIYRRATGDEGRIGAERFAAYKSQAR
jgi:hypothetical protein